MSSWNNLKDAGRMLPAWFFPFLLAGATVGLYVVARYITTEKPDELVSFITLSAIVLSLLVGFGFMVGSIAKAKQDNVLAAISEGFHRGLTFVWVTAAVCLCAYVCAAPAYRLVTENSFYAATAIGVMALLGLGYIASGLRPKDSADDDQPNGAGTTAVALPATFTQTQEQRPAFQVTIADQERLLIHQAARIIAYKGSNCLISDSFNAQLNLNARTASIFSDLNLLSTSDMIHWRMHMLMIGSAAERQLMRTSSVTAMDDLQNFDDLALQHLLLEGRGNFFKPVSYDEALLKANRLSLLRTSVSQRCAAAVAQNVDVINELVTLMRARPSLLYADLQHILERVEMPRDFPVAEFDSAEAMERVLMQLTHDEPEDIQGIAEHSDVSDATFTETPRNNVHPLKPETDQVKVFRA